MATDSADPPFRLRDWLTDRILRGLIWLMLLLPYERRIPFTGWLFSHVIAPVAGYRRRIRQNLALIFPDMDPEEVARLCRKVPDNVGRMMIEMYSGAEFVARATRTPLIGPGVAALKEAQATGRPVVLVSGHFGNFNAARPAIAAMGLKVGAFYRPMNNPYFNEHYVRAMESMSSPLFARDKAGMGAMLRFLRSGGVVGILIDQHMSNGERLTFLGHPARTALSAAELALRYDALLLPGYVIRKPDGLNFDIVMDEPVPHSDARTMTQSLNDGLERMVRAHIDQWFWIHRRWKS